MPIRYLADISDVRKIAKGIDQRKSETYLGSFGQGRNLKGDWLNWTGGEGALAQLCRKKSGSDWKSGLNSMCQNERGRLSKKTLREVRKNRRPR